MDIKDTDSLGYFKNSDPSMYPIRGISDKPPLFSKYIFLFAFFVIFFFIFLIYPFFYVK